MLTRVSEYVSQIVKYIGIQKIIENGLEQEANCSVGWSMIMNLHALTQLICHPNENVFVTGFLRRIWILQTARNTTKLSWCRKLTATPSPCRKAESKEGLGGEAMKQFCLTQSELHDDSSKWEVFASVFAVYMTSTISGCMTTLFLKNVVTIHLALKKHTVTQLRLGHSTSSTTTRI